MEENDQKTSEFTIRFMKNGVYKKQQGTDTIINGTIYILEQNGFIDFSKGNENNNNYVSNGINKSTGDGKKNRGLYHKTNHCFIGWNNETESPTSDSFSQLVPLSQVETIKRHVPHLNVHYIIITTRSGFSFEPYYFQQGGVREFLTILKNYVNLVKYERDPNMFRLDDFDISSVLRAEKDPPTPKEPARFLDKFAKITELTRAVGSKKKLDKVAAAKVNKALDKIVSTEQSKRMSIQIKSEKEDPFLTAVGAFEVYESIPDVGREKELTLDQFNSFLDSEGKITDEKTIRKIIFKGGIEPSARVEVWKFLLGLYPWDSTKKEREEILQNKNQLYQKWKDVYLFIDQNECRFSKFRSRKFAIEKDTVRTDRQIDIFKDDDSPYLQKLMHILVTYSVYNFDLGYCQGMNDLASPILSIMDDEAITFWCFKGIMDKMIINFNKDQSGIHHQLGELIKLVHVLDPELHDYLKKKETDNMFFAYRWVLLDFKREFSFTEIQRLWEVFWSNHLTDNFNLFFACAILLKQRDTIFQENMVLDDMIKFANSLANKIDLESTLIDAEKLFYIYVAQTERETSTNQTTLPNSNSNQN